MSRRKLNDLATLVLMNEAFDELEEDAEDALKSKDKETRKTWAKDWLQKRDQIDG
jgi:hypothetical protein